MVISYNWLQSYFTKKLPSPAELADLITFHVWEVEEVRTVTLADGSTDTVFDIKVLPDRSCYALSHKGVAYEVGAIFNEKPDLASDILIENKSTLINSESSASSLSISVQSDDCIRYVGRLLEAISVGTTSTVLKNRLEAVGQRSINSIVDALNYVMFDIGQPLHAFDADLVSGSITVRKATEGETMTTLDGKVLTLTGDMTVIADDKGPLALAGVKGGNRAGVTENTQRIILESATFDSGSVRRTSTRTGLRTDASKRFENNLSAETAMDAMDFVTRLILQSNTKAAVGSIIDIYPYPESVVTIEVDPQEIEAVLGVTISESDMQEILSRLAIGVEKTDDTFTLTIPFYRKDLRLPQDIAEEVGRLYGYEKLPPAVLPPSKDKEEIVPAYYYEQKIRQVLLGLGFSEVYTPTLVKDGVVAIANPLASDKRALRTSLTEGLSKAIELNTYNAPLLGLSAVKIFEIGTVFPTKDEKTVLGIAIHDIASKGKKNDAMVADVLENLGKELAIDLSKYTEMGKGMCQVDLSDVVKKLPKPQAYESIISETNNHFTALSPYPFITRDVAVFVPEATSEKELARILLEKAGPLLVRLDLFDVFKKTFDGIANVSYAFRLVFQSPERTLTDAEIETIMDSVHQALTEKGWKVR